MPYLFVSYDGGNSKAFLQCNSLLGAANNQAHLDIEDTPKTIGTANAPVVAFQLNDADYLWSIDAWGSVNTRNGCEWYTDEVGFSVQMAVGNDFGQLDLPGVKEDTAAEDGDEEQEGERTRKYMLRPVRNRWGGNAGDDKQARTKWGANVLQPRTYVGGALPKGTKAPKASKAPTTKSPKASKVRRSCAHCVWRLFVNMCALQIVLKSHIFPVLFLQNTQPNPGTARFQSPKDEQGTNYKISKGY